MFARKSAYSTRGRGDIGTLGPRCGGETAGARRARAVQSEAGETGAKVGEKEKSGRHSGRFARGGGSKRGRSAISSGVTVIRFTGLGGVESLRFCIKILPDNLIRSAL